MLVLFVVLFEFVRGRRSRANSGVLGIFASLADQGGVRNFECQPSLGGSLT